MISVDQIYLLQRKVESAVQKIEQLKSENDALRTKCSELTNALSEKTELLSSFTADEKKIEDGIMNALNRLDSVENSLLDNAGYQATSTLPPQQPVAVSVNAPAPTEQTPAQPVQVTVNVQTAPVQQPVEVVEPIQQPFEEQSVEPEPEPTIATTEEGSFFGVNPEDNGNDLFGDTSFETEEDNSTQDIF